MTEGIKNYGRIAGASCSSSARLSDNAVWRNTQGADRKTKMNLLDKNTVDAFLTRFDNFNDGLVCSVNLSGTVEQPEPTDLTFLAIARDSEGENGNEKVRVRFALTGVKEFCFRRKPRTSFALISVLGLQIGFFEDLIFLDFDANSELLTNISEFRRSGCYVGALKCEWELGSLLRTSHN